MPYLYYYLPSAKDATWAVNSWVFAGVLHASLSARVGGPPTKARLLLVEPLLLLLLVVVRDAGAREHAGVTVSKAQGVVRHFQLALLVGCPRQGKVFGAYLRVQRGAVGPNASQPASQRDRRAQPTPSFIAVEPFCWRLLLT